MGVNAAIDIQINGADDFLRLSKALKAAGRLDTRKELNKRLRIAAKPVVADVRAAFRSELPKRGGANEFLARKKVLIVTSTGRDPGVRVRVVKQDPRLETQGRLAHPVFNRRRANGKRVYVVQQVQPGLVGRQLEDSIPKVRRELERAIQTIADDVVKQAAQGGIVDLRGV